jgi:gluconolactonase
MIETGKAQLLVSGFDSPEGPAFDRDGNLFFVNWLTSSINRLDAEGTVTEFYNTGGIPAGLAFHPDGSLWVADEGDDIHGLMRITSDGRAEIAVNEYQGTPLNGANDLVIDRNGVIYFSDPWGSSAENPIGGFYRYHPDGRLEQIDTGLAFPNGVALNADESAVYLAETYKTRILRYEILADGSMGSAEEWAQTGEPWGPDGMAFDADGNLYCAHHNGARVDILAPNGEPIGEIPIPGAGVTNCAFGGPDRKTLVVTDVTSTSLYTVQMPIPGQPLNDR